MTRLFLALLLVAPACVRAAALLEDPAPAPVAAPAHDSAPGPITIAARLDAGALHVTLRLPRAALPAGAKRVEWVFMREEFGARPGGYADFAARITPSGDAPWEPAFDLGDADFELRYRVDLRHHEADPKHGLDAVPRPTGGGWQLVGRAFVPLLKVDGVLLDLPAELALDLPADWARVDTLPAAPRLRDLADAVYYLGRFARDELVHGAVAVQLVSSDMSPEARAGLRRLVERTLDAGEALLGPLPPGRRLLVYDRRERGFDGGVIGEAVTVLSSTPALDRAISPEGAIVVHELVHLWIGASAPWFSEGFTRYFQTRIQARLDDDPDLDATRRLVRRHDAYARAVGTRPLAGLDDDLAYDGGASLAYCLDTDLRTRGRDLESLFRAARERAREADRAFPTDLDLAAALDLADPTAAAALRQQLAAPGPIDLQPCLQRAGYRSQRRQYVGYSARAIALDILKAPSYSAQRAEFYQVRDGSIFRPGDILRAIDGRPVELVGDIDPLLARARRRVDVDVLRDGAPVRLRLDIPRVPAKERETHATLEVTAIGSDHAASPFRRRPAP